MMNVYLAELVGTAILMPMRVLRTMLCAAMIAATGAGCTPSPQSYEPNATDAVDAVLAGAVRRQDVLGVVAMATDRSGVIYTGAFGTGDDVHDVPMRTDRIFRIASMTKPVTSLAAMQLVEQGNVALDDRAADYLPALADIQVVGSFDAESGAYTVRPAETTLTVRHLLTHTSGFGYGFTSPLVRDFAPRDGDEFAAGPLVFDPGTDWLYGTSTDWVGRLVEAVSGQTLDAYFREHIFDPLAMPDTSYNVPEENWSRTVTIHNRRLDGGLFEQPREDPRPVETFSGGGGLWSTAGDYARFLRMLLNGGELDGVRVVSAASVGAMGTNQVGDLAAGTIRTAVPELSNDFVPTAAGRGRFGLGFLINVDAQPGRRAATSLAWAGLFNTYFWLDPTNGLAGVFLSQVLPFADPQVLTAFEEFERAVYALTDLP